MARNDDVEDPSNAKPVAPTNLLRQYEKQRQNMLLKYADSVVSDMPSDESPESALTSTFQPSQPDHSSHPGNLRTIPERTAIRFNGDFTKLVKFYRNDPERTEISSLTVTDEMKEEIESLHHEDRTIHTEEFLREVNEKWNQTALYRRLEKDRDSQHETLLARKLEERERQLRRHCQMLQIFLLMCIMIGLGFVLGYILITEDIEEPVSVTLARIKDRGFLNCGVARNSTGFSSFDEDFGEWRGFEVDLVRLKITDTCSLLHSTSNIVRYVRLNKVPWPGFSNLWRGWTL